MTSQNFYKILDDYNANLKKVTLKFEDEIIDIYFRAFTTDKHRDCQHRAIVDDTVTDASGNTKTNKKLDEFKYMANIVALQSLNEDGERIFNNITDADKLIKKLPYVKMAQLASVMGADIEAEIREAIGDDDG